MAVLPDEDRREAWADWRRGPIGEILVSKADLRATFDALDSFFNANSAAINNAIPAGPRAALTTAQKASILVAVIRQRHLKGV